MLRRRRSLLLNAALAVVLLAVGVTAVLLLTGSSDDQATAGTTVRTATAQLGDVSATVAASGQVSAVRSVDVDFSTSGTLATVDVAVGQTVTAGQQLGTLDSDDAQAALDEAEDQLAAAKDTLQAAEDAEDAAASASTTDATGQNTGGQNTGQSGGTVSVSSAKASVTQAQAAVNDARDALDATTLTAPTAGLVTAVNGTVGAAAGSSSGAGGATGGATGSSGSTAFVTIADTSAYVVSASFAEADIASLAAGQAATVTFPAVDGVTATAKVTAIAPTATTTNNVVTYAATITLDALPDGIRLGQSAQISVVTASATNVLQVPSAAVTDGAGGTHRVTVVGADGSRTATAVEVGVVGDFTTEITSGLKEGDKVLISVDTATTGTGSSDQQQGGFPGGGFQGGGGFPGGGAGFPGGGN